MLAVKASNYDECICGRRYVIVFIISSQAILEFDLYVGGLLFVFMCVCVFGMCACVRSQLNSSSTTHLTDRGIKIGK